FFPHRKARPEQFDRLFLTRAHRQLLIGGKEVIQRSEKSAFGLSLPDPVKSTLRAGWFFGANECFDAVVAGLLPDGPSPKEAAEVSRANLAYAAGANPINRSYLTGLGWQLQRQIVSQFAENDSSTLPPYGLPLGNVQTGPPMLRHFKTREGKNLLQRSIYPYKNTTFPLYDRWSDTHNAKTEFVIPQLARSTAVSAWLMANGPLRTQPWKSGTARIVGLTKKCLAGSPVALRVDGSLNLQNARITWEAPGLEPRHGQTYSFRPVIPGPNRVTADVLLPDGRRLHALGETTVSIPIDLDPVSLQAAPLPGHTRLLLAESFENDLSSNGWEARGKALFPDPDAFTWKHRPENRTFRFQGPDNELRQGLPPIADLPTKLIQSIAIEVLLYIEALPENENADLLVLQQGRSSAGLRWQHNKYKGPLFSAGNRKILTDQKAAAALPAGGWHHLRLVVSNRGASIQVDGETLVEVEDRKALKAWSTAKEWTVSLGHFTGWVDDLQVSIQTQQP
ncbi:MAG: hypothetical protein AAF514_13845, partial [Verrucomicrobiota bacterium]